MADTIWAQFWNNLMMLKPHLFFAVLESCVIELLEAS
jgi:hypothetical protein